MKIAGMVLVLAALGWAFEGDKFAEKFQSLPQAVRDTAKANMENAFPVSISSSKSERGWDYQINTRVDGKFHDIVIDESGKLVALKDETELGALPAAAKSAIEKAAATAKIVTLEKVTEGARVSYGAVLRDEAQGKNIQVRVGADGSLQSRN
jgi:hypothetical protein